MSTKKSSRKLNATLAELSKNAESVCIMNSNTNTAVTVINNRNYESSDTIIAVSISDIRNSNTAVLDLETFKIDHFSILIELFNCAKRADEYKSAISNGSSLEFRNAYDHLLVKPLSRKQLIQLLEKIPSTMRSTSNKIRVFSCCFSTSFIESDKKIADTIKKIEKNADHNYLTKHKEFC
jgi:hypothetical protein